MVFPRCQTHLNAQVKSSERKKQKKSNNHLCNRLPLVQAQCRAALVLGTCAPSLGLARNKRAPKTVTSSPVLAQFLLPLQDQTLSVFVPQ